LLVVLLCLSLRGGLCGLLRVPLGLGVRMGSGLCLRVGVGLRLVLGLELRMVGVLRVLRVAGVVRGERGLLRWVALAPLLLVMLLLGVCVRLRLRQGVLLRGVVGVPLLVLELVLLLHLLGLRLLELELVGRELTLEGLDP
jgi:hypothetical protein